MVLTLYRDNMTTAHTSFYVDESTAISGTPPVPFFIQIDDEIMEVTYKNTESPPSGRSYYAYVVTRGSKGTTPSEHLAGAKIKLLLESNEYRKRPIGLGSKELLLSTSLDGKYGYYGKYQGICTPNELISLAGITEGTTKNDAYNDPNADITWLKFSHNYKTLFVADRTIHNSVSWNHLDSKGVVFGKVVDIDGQKYLLRLLQGANVNPASVKGGANSNDEWDSLIVQFTPNTEDSHFGTDIANTNGGSYAWCQETYYNDTTRSIIRGSSTVDSLSPRGKDTKTTNDSYRPVLEVL